MNYSNSLNEVGDNFQKTRASVFASKRGILVIKEFHPVASIRIDSVSEEFRSALGLLAEGAPAYLDMADYILFDALVFGAMSGDKAEKAFGVRATVHKPGNDEATEPAIFVDYEEIPELVRALDYFLERHAEIEHTAVDYTELTYSTIEGFRVGFYVDPNAEVTCQAFVSTDNTENIFFEPGKLMEVIQACNEACEYLGQRGAT
jgi:hypothetical protein